ncbi:MAG TPA: FtsX-like permease family protein [Pirellulales bacterium]|jgi:lipoprotein-releasing system permease protein|nr:FtsX-like permease family protein [Pirellulales bacterium]
MYKYVLCWRYLRTRYIALASIISVTLGVATMIVVNSVMAGFNREMQQRIHGILSDIVFESRSLSGFQDPQYHMDEIRRVAGDDVIGMTPTIIVPGMLSFQVRGETITRQVNLIGIDQQTHAQVSDFSQFLQHPANREALSFDLREDGYDKHDHQVSASGVSRPQMEIAGWNHRRWQAIRRKELQRSMAPAPDGTKQLNPFAAGSAATADAPAATDSDPAATFDGAGAETAKSDRAETAATATADPDPTLDPGKDIFEAYAEPEKVFDAQHEQHTGAVLGIALANYRSAAGREEFLLLPGDDVTLLVPTAGNPPKGSMDNFTVVDFYESKMSEYDSAFVFVPLAKLQAMRGMDGKTTGVASVTSIQIRLRPGADGDDVCRRLRATFPPELYGVQTWRDKQGPLLAAVQMETAILNVLLFMIIAVAGFGILAIFFMIVVEKTRDIGILKSLGASGTGIMGIFLAYGLSLGIVGSGVGMALGLLFVVNINQIAALLGVITGREVFDPAIYYFQQIPTLVDPFTVAWIVAGAMLIAVVASILPARRAARLHPVEALRYE